VVVRKLGTIIRSLRLPQNVESRRARDPRNHFAGEVKFVGS